MEDEMQSQGSNSYARNNNGIVVSGVLCGFVQGLYVENRNKTRESAGRHTSLSLRLL
jgi:hypothetical protein